MRSATVDKPSAWIFLSLSLSLSLPSLSIFTKEYDVKGFRGDKEYRFIIRRQYGERVRWFPGNVN